MGSKTDTFTLKEALSKYGSEEQVNAFERVSGSSKKKKGNLKSNQFNALKKTLHQHYEEVEVEGKGSDRIFVCNIRKKEPSTRVDRRIDNGKNQIPLEIEQALPVMILEYLDRRSEEEESEEPLTINKWLLNMGLISPQMFGASRLKYNKGVLSKEIEKLTHKDIRVISGSEDACLVVDYIENEIERMQRKFMNVITKLKRSKIIYHKEEWIAKRKVPYHAEEHIVISSSVVRRISALKRSLQDLPKYKDLSLSEINKLKAKPLVKEFWEEYQEKLCHITNDKGERLYIEYYYQSHAFFVSTGKKQTIKWLEKNNKEALEFYKTDEAKYLSENKFDFHYSWNGYIFKLAENRQENFRVKESTKEFGGKVNTLKFDNDKFKRVQELKIKGLYVQAYKKLQEYYGINF